MIYWGLNYERVKIIVDKRVIDGEMSETRDVSDKRDYFFSHSAKKTWIVLNSGRDWDIWHQGLT